MANQASKNIVKIRFIVWQVSFAKSDVRLPDHEADFYMKYKNNNRHLFLLTFFPVKEEYCVKEINNFILVKYFSNNTHKWEVMIYSKESYKKAKEFIDKVPVRQVSNSGQTTII